VQTWGGKGPATAGPHPLPKAERGAAGSSFSNFERDPHARNHQNRISKAKMIPLIVILDTMTILDEKDALHTH